MIKFFTKFLPKDRTYGMMIKNKVRIHLAICIGSVGYQSTYGRLAEKTGLGLEQVQQEMNRLLAVRKVYKRNYRKKTVNKIRRKTKFYDKMRENSAKLITENKKDLQYSSGIAGPFKEDRRQPIGRRKEKV
jgi:hypothetical protein